MDGVVIIALSFVWLLLNLPKADTESGDVITVEHIDVNPRLNPEMHHDEHAFMKIANELGFH